jgi:hypothetical protein
LLKAIGKKGDKGGKVMAFPQYIVKRIDKLPSYMLYHIPHTYSPKNVSGASCERVGPNFLVLTVLITIYIALSISLNIIRWYGLVV